MGDYEHTDYYIFNRRKYEWGYCKEFWGISKRDSNYLKDGVFWNDEMNSAISVYSETEISQQEADLLKTLGVA